ncbi:MAG: dhps: dihydropteroate synthase [Akkermansiaceae bacterium]|nr:dhps: dihydropteroate synthase [Akkermansiaceae bacterium]
MGILNVTPDSFSDGGRHATPAAALERSREMIGEGAEIIDIGGESTRPGAPEIPADEEIARTVPLIATLRAEWDGLISIDTSKPAVAAAAMAAGADIINDVNGLRREGMAEVCLRYRAAAVVMHMQGTPRTMQHSPHYEDVVAEVRAFFAERLATLTALGISPEALVFDPGIGFGKTVAHNLTLLRNVRDLGVAGRPLLIGVSRKSFIGQILGSQDLAVREWPTVALTASTREAGAMLHRVHQVLPNVQALRMTEAILATAAV